MFEVIWNEAALEELADVWVSLSPTNRDKVETAIINLNNRLADDPLAESDRSYAVGLVSVDFLSPERERRPKLRPSLASLLPTPLAVGSKPR